jgi:hypothetical protein
MTIEAAHYAETRQSLMQDPIIIQMAQEIREDPDMDLDTLLHAESGEPHWGFMNAARHNYRKRGGEVESHIGGPAEAIVALLRDG